MAKFGFPQVWIFRVMQLVRTITYYFVRDGKMFGDVRSYRGVRQGDSISPYLYIICAEGLTGILRKYEESGLIHGCRVARDAPRITHLFLQMIVTYSLKLSTRKNNICRVFYKNMKGYWDRW